MSLSGNVAHDARHCLKSKDNAGQERLEQVGSDGICGRTPPALADRPNMMTAGRHARG